MMPCHPPIKKISHCPDALSGISGVFDEFAKSGGGVASRAVDGLGRPPFTTTVSIHSEITDDASYTTPAEFEATYYSQIPTALEVVTQ